MIDDCKIVIIIYGGLFFYEYSQELGVKCILGHRFFDYYLTLLHASTTHFSLDFCPSLIFIMDI